MLSGINAQYQETGTTLCTAAMQCLSSAATSVTQRKHLSLPRTIHLGIHVAEIIYVELLEYSKSASEMLQILNYSNGQFIIKGNQDGLFSSTTGHSHRVDNRKTDPKSAMFVLMLCKPRFVVCIRIL